MQRLYGPGGPVRSLSADEVAENYPWPDSGSWVRAMMVTTLDGAAAGPDGLSGSISSPADQSVFNAVRRFADVVLVGRGTLAAEEYSPMVATPADAERRASQGQLRAPVIAVASGSLRLPWHLPLWRESTHRPIVLTGAEVDPARLDEAKQHADVIQVPTLDPGSMVDALGDRGLRRILCEGGPRFLNDMVRAGRVDELDITVSPTIAGTATSPETAALPEVASFHLANVLTQDDVVMLRYLAEEG